MKKFILIFSLVIVCFGVLYGGLHLFGWYIFNTQSCHSFNIDNIELRTGVNIPEVTSTDCECKDHKKISKFIIDTNKVDLNNYIENNDLIFTNGLYIKENNNKNSNYKVVFNKETAELTINLIYKNN